MSAGRDCIVVRSGSTEPGPTGLGYFVGVCSETAGSERFCLQLVRVPPGGRADAHSHVGHETAVYVLEGEVVTWYGEWLESWMVTGCGDFAYIPPGVPHVAANYAAVEAVAVIARTDPHAQESVVALPALDELPHLRNPPAGLMGVLS